MKTIVHVYQDVSNNDTFVTVRNFSEAEQVRFGYLQVATTQIEYEKLSHAEVKQKLGKIQPEGNKALYLL